MYSKKQAIDHIAKNLEEIIELNKPSLFGRHSEIKMQNFNEAQRILTLLKLLEQDDKKRVKDFLGFLSNQINILRSRNVSQLANVLEYCIIDIAIPDKRGLDTLTLCLRAYSKKNNFNPKYNVFDVEELGIAESFFPEATPEVIEGRRYLANQIVEDPENFNVWIFLTPPRVEIEMSSFKP